MIFVVVCSVLRSQDIRLRDGVLGDLTSSQSHILGRHTVPIQGKKDFSLLRGEDNRPIEQVEFLFYSDLAPRSSNWLWGEALGRSLEILTQPTYRLKYDDSRHGVLTEDPLNVLNIKVVESRKLPDASLGRDLSSSTDDSGYRSKPIVDKYSLICLRNKKGKGVYRVCFGVKRTWNFLLLVQLPKRTVEWNWR